MSERTSRYACPASMDWSGVDGFALRDCEASVPVELEPERWRHLLALVCTVLDRSDDAAHKTPAAEELRVIGLHIYDQLETADRVDDLPAALRPEVRSDEQ